MKPSSPCMRWLISPLRVAHVHTRTHARAVVDVARTACVRVRPIFRITSARNIMSASVASEGAGALPSASSGASKSVDTVRRSGDAVSQGTDAPTLQDHVVIYDGVCNLCHGTVKFLIARDPARVYRFCALQSEAAKPYLAAHGITPDDALKSIIFIDGGVAYRKSDAAMQIAKYLPAPWRWIGLTRVCVPLLLRDFAYDVVASNRYWVFGQADGCLIPTKDIMSRFLDVEEIKRQGRKKAAKAE